MQVVHEANAENLRLKEMLLMRENRIAELESEVEALNKVIATGVNPAGDAGDTSPQYFGWGGRQWEYPHQYYYVLLDIADQYWLPSVRSASSRFHSAIRRHQFASVRQADSRLTRLQYVLPTLNSR